MADVAEVTCLRGAVIVSNFCKIAQKGSRYEIWLTLDENCLRNTNFKILRSERLQSASKDTKLNAN